MYGILMGYLSQLPGAMQEKELPSGEKVQECVYPPHSLRATTATLLLDARESIESVQGLLDHKHMTTTQIYDKRRRNVRNSASQKVPI
jgi:site-specific recombinase XerD